MKKIERAIDTGFHLAEGATFLDQLAAVARQTAVDAMDEAIFRGGDPVEINEAQQALSGGDALRAAGDFLDAVDEYEDAAEIAAGA